MWNKGNIYVTFQYQTNSKCQTQVNHWVQWIICQNRNLHQCYAYVRHWDMLFLTIQLNECSEELCDVSCSYFDVFLMKIAHTQFPKNIILLPIDIFESLSNFTVNQIMFCKSREVFEKKKVLQMKKSIFINFIKSLNLIFKGGCIEFVEDIVPGDKSSLGSLVNC